MKLEETIDFLGKTIDVYEMFGKNLLVERLPRDRFAKEIRAAAESINMDVTTEVTQKVIQIGCL